MNTNNSIKNIIMKINNINLSKNYSNNKNEDVFWNVIHNSNLFNQIFKRNMDKEGDIELIDGFKFSKKFKNIISLEWVIEKKEYELLIEKVKNSQYIHIEKTSLNLLFNLCTELEVFKGLFENSRFTNIDPIFYSTKNNNLPILALFINYYNLPIYPSVLEFSIINCSLKTINFLIQSLLKRGIQIYESVKEKAIYNSLKNYKSVLKSNNVTEYLLENKQQLLPISNMDVFKISINSCLKIKSIQIRQKLFDYGYLDFYDISPVLEEWLIDNYKNLTILDLCFVLDMVSSCHIDDIDLRDPPQLKIVLKSVRERVAEGIVGEEEEMKVLLLLKSRLIQLVRVDKLYIEFLNEYGFIKAIDSLEYCPIQMVYQYTFQSFDINGLNYLSLTQSDVQPVCQNQIIIPNPNSLLDQQNIVDFIKLYYSTQNSLFYDGWNEISKFLLLNCSLDILDEIFEIPGYPIKTFLIPDLQFEQFSKYQWFIEKIVIPYGSKQFKMSSYSSYFKNIQVSPDYNFRIKDPSVLISINNLKEIDFIDRNRDYFQIGPNSFSKNSFNRKLIGGSGFFTIINSIESARYCSIKFPNIPKDLIYYNLIENTILSSEISTLKSIDQYDNIKLNYFKGVFKLNHNVSSEKIIQLFNYLNSSGFKSFSKSNGIYYLILSLVNSFSNELNPQYELLIDIISNLNINQFPKCFMDLFITFCFSKNQFDLELSKIILKKLDFQKLVKESYSFSDLKFKFYKNLLDQHYSVDKRRDANQYQIILEMIDILLTKVPKESQKNFYPLYQHLYNLSVSCCIDSLDKIAELHRIYNSNSIPLKIGFYHTFFYLDIKTTKLGRYYLFIRVEGLENDTFDHTMGYNGEIIPQFSLDKEFPFDFILKNSYVDIYYLLRTIIMVKPLPSSDNFISASYMYNFHNPYTHIHSISNNNNNHLYHPKNSSDDSNTSSSKISLSESCGSIYSDVYSIEDQSFCDEKHEEFLYSLNDDVQYLSTFNSYDLVYRLLKDSIEVSDITGEDLRDRAKSFLISAIDTKSLKKILSLGIKNLDLQLLEQSFYEHRLDLIRCILNRNQKLNLNLIKSHSIKNDKHFLFQSNHIEIIGFMFEYYIDILPEFDSTWFDVSFENGYIEMCCLILKYYPKEKIIITIELLEKTIQNNNINIIKYFYQNYNNSLSYLKLEIQSLIKSYYPLDYKYFNDWLN